jgi:hypothetical protein
MRSGVQDHRECLHGPNTRREVQFDTRLDVVFGDTFMPNAQGSSQLYASEV